MAFTVVYDACVLYPAPLRDLLLRIAQTGLVRARWTELILDECFESLSKDRPDLSADLLLRTRRLMNDAVPDCLVPAHELVVVNVRLPDPGDLHVLAAAVTCGAQAIITFNLSDFPPNALAPFGLEAKHPDDFVLDAIHLQPALVVSLIEHQSSALKRPPMTVEELLGVLRARGLPQSVAKLHELRGSQYPDE